LLRAFAANGLGKTEEAVRWTEKASSANAPDGASGSAKTARAIALNFLAWARQDSTPANRPEDMARLRSRAKALLATETPASSVRIALSWSHPDFHPVLWTDALGAMMPASDGDPMLGISQANVPLSKKTSLELRLDAEEARIAIRFGLQATITAAFNEGSAQERIIRIPIRIFPNFTSPIRFSVSDGTLSQEGQR
jgi:Ca-activated chloride channel family protein